MQIFYFDRKYGVQSTVYFVAADPASDNSDNFYNDVAVWAGAGECIISKDGGAFSDTTNDPVRVGTTPLFSLTLTAAELQCNEAFIILTESGATAARDAFIIVRTHLQLGSADIDAATGQKTDTSALKLSGYGAGHGLEAVGGSTGQDINGILGEHVLRASTATAGGGSTITLDASASTTNDYYNGAIIQLISGTGAGQARVITDYVGSTKVATVNKAWATQPVSGTRYMILGGDDPWQVSPGAELPALPTYASTYAAMIQFLFQRFAYKRTQSGTTFTMIESDGSTPFASGSVTDNFTVQTYGALGDL